MGHETTLTEDFLTKANTVLQETEDKLTELAQTALLANLSPNPPLQKISQNLMRLVERCQAVHHTLRHNLTAPLNDDDHWPLIRVLQSQEEEQTQLAREMEDRVGQLLANAVFELASCRQLLGHDEAAVSTGLEALQSELEQGLSDVRWFIVNLEPATIMGNFGLSAGLRRYLERYETRTNITVKLRIEANMGRLPSIIEVAIFRVMQEALSNVHRHAAATQVSVMLEEHENRLDFTVIDNGRGLILDEFSRSRKNLGLARMVDYAELLNGRLKILSAPNQGTQVILAIPYPIL